MHAEARPAQALDERIRQSSAATYHRVLTLASGGMGRVELTFRREGTFQRLYAVKRLHPHLVGEPEIRAMFVDEARIAGLLRHPNVVSVVDVGEDDAGPFLVMDYVEGAPLSALITRSAKSGELLPLDVALRILLDATRGLAAAHDLTTPEGGALGLVHRDISPHNILVGYDGVARLTDFGIAKALGQQTRTSTGILKGKLAYMAPEQLRFAAPDRRTDLFALGIVLYETITSRRLYAEKLPEATAKRILEEPPPDLGDQREDVPAEVVRLFFSMLAKDPVHRPASAHEVAQVLEEALVDLRVMGLSSTSPGAYLGDLFEAERTRGREDVAAALAAMDRASSAPPDAIPSAAAAPRSTASSPPAPTRSVRGLVLAIGAASLLALGAALWALGSFEASDPSALGQDSRDEESASAPATPSDPVEAPASAQRADEAAPLASPTEPEAPAEIEESAQSAASAAPDTPSPRSRGAARPGRRAPRSEEGESVRVWGWQQ